MTARGVPTAAGRRRIFTTIPGLLAASVALAGCQHISIGPGKSGAGSERGSIVLRGLIDCFEEGLSADELPVYCEASAVAFAGHRLTVASDKPVPGTGRSAVFSMPYKGSGQITGDIRYETATPFLEAVKYEDMALTPDGRHVIATTGFDRVKRDTHEWDGYNTLLFWPSGRPGEVSVVSPVTNDGVTSSVSLRKQFSDALRSVEFPDEVPYFKVESLAAIPGDRLLFGIREIGVHYERFVYSFKIISAPYRIENGQFSFMGDFELVYDFDMQDSLLQQEGTALSSIEYDRFHDRLYILTSFENGERDEDLGGHLWTLSLQDLASGRPPKPVLDASARPLEFAHKAEGVAVLEAETILVIHDDDRVLGREVVENPETQFSRRAHQAAYTLVSIGDATSSRPTR